MSVGRIYELPRDASYLVSVIQDAGVIWAVDRRKHTRTLVYGKEAVEAASRHSIPEDRLQAIAFYVDFSWLADDVEYLCAAVKSAKGRHEFRR